MKSTPQTEELYERFLNNQATAAEVEALLKQFELLDKADLYALISASLQNNTNVDVVDKERLNHLSNLRVKIAQRIDTEAPVVKLDPERNIFMFSKIAAAIAAVALLGIIAYAIFSKTAIPGENIIPAGTYAMLTTPEGNHVDLQKNKTGLLAHVGGVQIYKTAEGHIVYTAKYDDTASVSQMNTIVTPRGGHYKITLADNSVVILNAGSSLQFPVGFYGQQRVVILKGEAYFEVAKNPLKPFIVRTATITTRVLGTKFNISSYADDTETKATLLEGKIQVTQNNTKQSAILKPGQQASVNDTRFTVDSVDAGDAAAWKDGIFVFKNEELNTIMRHLSRWYDIDIDYSSLPADTRLYVKISRKVNLSEVLRMLSLTSNLKFKMEGRRLSVIK